MISMITVFRIVLVTALLGLSKGYFDMSIYRQMPPLYAADNYMECLQKPTSSYCMVYAELQADNSSALWQQIWNFQNSYRYHYRHDQLYRAVCTAKCEKYLQNSSSESPHGWNLTAVQPTSDNVEMAKKLHKISREQRSITLNERQLHECVNGEMQDNYNLSVKTFVTYCESPREPMEKDSWYTFTIIVLIGLGILNFLSTLYDFHLKSQQSENDAHSNYYDKNHKNSANNYLCSFSFYRNYRRLVVPNNSASGRDLQFIDGFRTILSMTIITEHLVYAQYMPIENSDLIEVLYSTSLILSLQHILICIELFFLLSGLMMYIKFNKNQFVTATSSVGECITVYIRMMISRYLRYIPSLILLILFSSNVLIHLQNGPFWRHIIEPNVMLCRNEWWSNIFMTANLGINNCCLAHTWYIAADFQLYAVFLCVLVLAAKYPKYKKLIYATIGITGVTLPSIISYVKKLQSLSTMNIESDRHMYLKDVETGLHMYLPPYANLNGFFIGIMCGELYTKYLKNDRYKENLRQYLKYLPVIGWLTIFSIWYMGSIIIFNEPSIWTALFAIPHRHLSVAIVALIVIIYNMCSGGGFLTWPIFRPLARISYQVYLWHFLILFSIFGKSQQPLNISILYMVKLFTVTYLLAAVASFLIAIMFEYPMAELLSAFDLKSKNKPKASKNS